MTKLHEILAVEGDTETVAKKIVAEAQDTFSKKQNLFMGRDKLWVMFDDKEHVPPAETQKLETTVHEKLDYVGNELRRWFDAVLQKEKTNQEAVADLEVDGKVLAEGLPATFLLGLENKLKGLRSMYEAIPTLQPGVDWELDEQEGKGVYRTEEPVRRFKTAKTFVHKVLYEATEHHPAQIERWEEQQNVGESQETFTCGMLTSADKQLILNRLETLLRATKRARMRANNIDVVKVKIGKAIVDYLHG